MDNEAQNLPADEAEELDDSTRYALSSKAEIAYVLRAVMRKRELVTAHFNHGRDFILTSILEVDPDEETIFFDHGANAALNRRILDASRIIFVTRQDRVKVQFVAEGIEDSEYGGRPAFVIDFPESVLKLQRRDYFRLDTPITNPIKCTIPRPNGTRVEVTVVDISVGGIGAIHFPPDLEPTPGLVLPDCRIVLPDVGVLMCTLEVRNVYPVTLKTGAQTMRCGCCFVDCPASTQAMIQRYITKLERERRAKLAGG